MNKKRVALALAAALGINTLMVTVGQVGEQLTVAHAQNARLSTEDAKKLQGVNVKQLDTTVTSLSENGKAEITIKDTEDIKVADIEDVKISNFNHERFAERKITVGGKEQYLDSNVTAKGEWKNGKILVDGATEPGIYTTEVTISYKDKSRSNETYVLTLVNKKADEFTLKADVTPAVIKVTDVKLDGIDLSTVDNAKLSIRKLGSAADIQTGVVYDATQKAFIFNQISSTDLVENQVFEIYYTYGIGDVYTAVAQIMLTKAQDTVVKPFVTNKTGFDAELQTQIQNDYVTSSTVTVDPVAGAGTTSEYGIKLDNKVLFSYVQTTGAAQNNLAGANLNVKENVDGTVNLSVVATPGGNSSSDYFVYPQRLSYGVNTNLNSVGSSGVIGDYYFEVGGKSSIYFHDNTSNLSVMESTATNSAAVYLGATSSLPNAIGRDGTVGVDLNLDHGYTSLPVTFDVNIEKIDVKTINDKIKSTAATLNGATPPPANNYVEVPVALANYKGAVKTTVIVSVDKFDAVSVQAVFNKTGDKTGTFTLVNGKELVKGLGTSEVSSRLTFPGHSGISVRYDSVIDQNTNNVTFNLTFSNDIPQEINWKFVASGSNFEGKVAANQSNFETINFAKQVGVADVPNTTAFKFVDANFVNSGFETSDLKFDGNVVLDNVSFTNISDKKQHDIQATISTGKYQGTYKAGLWITQQPFTAVAKDAKSASNTSASLVIDANFIDKNDIDKVTGGIIQYSEKTVNGNTTTWSDWKDSSTKIEKADVKEDAITKTVTGLTAGKTYRFRAVYDYNTGSTAQKVESTPSNEVTLPTSSNNNSTITGNGSSSTTTGTSTGSTTITVTTSNSTLTGTSASVTLPSGFRYDSGKTPVAVTLKYKDKDGKIVTETKEQYSNVTARFNGNNVELNGLVPGKDYNEITVDYTDNNGKTRSIILKNVKTTSQTQVETYLANVYEVVFGRPADEAGYHFHLDNLKNKKVSLRDFLLNMLNEKEFVEKYKSTEEKIEALYNAIVSRTSDEAGKKFWVDEYKKVLAVYGSESTALRAIADRMVNENELKELADKMGVQW